jgi:hypothetical protein
MRRIRAVVVLGLVGVVGLATGCKDEELRYYLGKDGRMYEWQLRVDKAICQLEKNTTGIPQGDKVCPEEDPSITPPPSYPPK